MKELPKPIQIEVEPTRAGTGQPSSRSLCRDFMMTGTVADGVAVSLLRGTHHAFNVMALPDGPAPIARVPAGLSIQQIDAACIACENWGGTTSHGRSHQCTL